MDPVSQLFGNTLGAIFRGLHAVASDPATGPMTVSTAHSVTSVNPVILIAGFIIAVLLLGARGFLLGILGGIFGFVRTTWIGLIVLAGFFAVIYFFMH